MKVSHVGTDYQNSHGKRPRGWGMWMFRVSVYAPGRGWTDLGDFTETGNWGEAFRAVRTRVLSEARSIGGATEVQVVTCP